MIPTAVRFAFWILVFHFVLNGNALAGSTKVVSQLVVYKTNQASEVILVWGINEWKFPGEKWIPPNSVIKDSIVYTTLTAQADSFYVNIRLPENTYLNYIFWHSKDQSGAAHDYWDKNNNQNYNTYVNKNSSSIVHIDTYSHLSRSFNLFSNAFCLFLISAGLFIISFFYQKRLKFSAQGNSRIALFIGTATGVFLLMLLTRLQMNLAVSENGWLIAGAGFYDGLFLFSFALTGFLLLRFLKTDLFAKMGFALVYSLLILFALFSILNIDIVKYLGTPLNYQWMYYSDFLQSADAKSSLMKNFNALFFVQVAMLIVFVVLFGIALRPLFRNYVFSRYSFYIIIILSVTFLVIGNSQRLDKKFERKNIANPVVTLAASWFKSDKRSEIFSMSVSDSTKNEIRGLFESMPDLLPIKDSISNVVIFVLESTPAEYLDVYESKYEVTPNLLKWSRHARIFTNIYAHVPATPNSLFSIVSGMYPEISYKLTCNEYPDFPVSSIANILDRNHWQVGTFHAADIHFNRMGEYLEFQGFDTIADFRNFACENENFRSNWEYLDGIADECMVDAAIGWMEMSDSRKMALCWTMQTHYPYFTIEKEKHYSSNSDFNRYLNALSDADNAFGKLMNYLESNNILDETLVIVVGDHGEAFGRHDQTTHGSKIYEENVHIPCLLINPKLFNGESDDRIGGLVDLASTISHILNIKQPQAWQGRSLIAAESSGRVFFFCPYADFLFGTRNDSMKFIYNATESEFELYNLNSDPYESNNLAEKYPDIVEKEYEHLAAWAQYQSARMRSYFLSNDKEK